MTFTFRPEAQKELLEARLWYEALSPGLGYEFARAIDVAIENVIRTPQAFPRIAGEFRHVVTRKFPYSIIYFQTELEIIGISCFHHRRKPGSWLPKDIT
jgi:plasmid stabilization system protein ParE